MSSRSFVPAFLTVLAFAAGCEPQVDTRAKADEIRAALQSAQTRDDFMSIAQRNGLACFDIDASRVSCTWHQPRKPSLAFATPCGETPGMVSADATFVDGRRQGDYDIRDSYTGC
jgi:hypothetical protein